MLKELIAFVLIAAVGVSPFAYSDDIDPDTVDYSTYTWVAVEMSFVSTKRYQNPLMDCDFDVVFTSPCGEKYKMPGFWDGGYDWRVRFAPTSSGVWKYQTVSSDPDNGLHGLTGTLAANPYTGNLPIYKHGFVRTQPDIRYFMYADGTPFFYLGDTNWNMPQQPIDSSNHPEIDSMFKYLLDRRVEQGFTVYQSQPIGTDSSWGAGGIVEHNVEDFRDMDRRFRYIAEKGFVHANSQLVWAKMPTWMPWFNDKKLLDKVCRHWVARYAAYPVMWTTAQESDPDHYGHFADYNPWLFVAERINYHDPYNHPLTAHQENMTFQSVPVPVFTSPIYRSAFEKLPPHSWHAVQWHTETHREQRYEELKHLWYRGGGKPVVNFEGRYENLWTNNFGARVQGWTAFLNGMFGHGYGSIDIWLYNSTYDVDTTTVVDGGTIVTTPEDKDVKWYVSINFPTRIELGHHMRGFFESFEWWKLVPCFDEGIYFTPASDSSFYAVSTIGTELYTAYFYNRNADAGTFHALEQNRTYTAQWFSPRTGEYTLIDSNISGTGERVSWTIPDKPDDLDWVVLMTMNE